MNKKVPMRQCVGCGEMRSKREMMRVLRTPEGEKRQGRISVQRSGLSEESGKEQGTGAFLQNKNSGRGL